MPRIHKQIKKLPDTAGVYFFKQGKEILYIGKATNLRERVKSYFALDLYGARGPLIARMIEEASSLEYEETDSVLEALVLEANLIKKYQPPYNTREKDQKSYNHVVITAEEYPRVFSVRGRELQTRYDPDEFRYVFGPYPHGSSLREAIKIVRRIFPFRGEKDPVKPSKKKSPLKRQMGLLPNFSKMGKKEYRRRIQHIRLFFEGRKKQLVRNLAKEMKEHAREKEFEKAENVKRQIFALEHINDVALIKPDMVESAYSDKELFRIEAYDIAHVSGSEMVGVMTVIEAGFAKKSDYRKFKIRTVENSNDTAALKEVLERRFTHSEWQLPRLIVVDGGKAQVNAAEAVLETFGYQIPVVGVVKDEKHRPTKILGEKKYRKEYESEILLVNSEAHRFAQNYHSHLRRKRMK